MKNLLALLGLAIVVGGAVGWHQGWYKLHVSKNADGTVRVQTDVNTDRVGDTFHRAGEFIKEQGKGNLAATPDDQDPNAKAPLQEGAGWLIGNILSGQSKK